MKDEHRCCTPARDGVDHPRESADRPVVPAADGTHPVAQAHVPRHEFMMGDFHGDGFPGDREGPPRPQVVNAFDIDATTVTVAAFDAFVAATGYETEAETFGYSAVFEPFFSGPPSAVVGRAPGTPWWIGVRGADWRHPEGPASHVDSRLDHPVVHVSWNDAQAYCAWAGRRLPTEAEWEAASRGGLDRKRYPWGDELLADGRWRCNIWQGTFPSRNTGDDGWLSTAPVHTYEPNGFGLWQTVGNVWEWSADPWDRNTPAPRQRVMRGGSFLCHDSYCNRYRNSARSANTADSSTANTGFRTVAEEPHAQPCHFVPQTDLAPRTGS